MVTPGLDLFALVFALFKAGAVPVLVDPGIGLKHLKACLGNAKPEAFVGVPKAHAARVILGWARETVRTKVTAGPRLFWGGATLRRLPFRGRPGQDRALQHVHEAVEDEVGAGHHEQRGGGHGGR